MEIVDLTRELASRPGGRPWIQRHVELVSRFVLHHAASSERATVYDLHAYHLRRGWYRISYHYVVGLDGRTYKCNTARDITWTVAKGNTSTLSVCLVGNRSLVPPPPAQWAAAVELFRDIKGAYPWVREIRGHRECPDQATECPGRLIDMDEFRAAVRT